MLVNVIMTTAPQVCNTIVSKVRETDNRVHYRTINLFKYIFLVIRQIFYPIMESIYTFAIETK